MKIKFIGLILMLIGFSTVHAQQQVAAIQYSYDDSGNRIRRQLIFFNQQNLKMTNDSIWDSIVKEETDEEDKHSEEQILETTLNGAAIKIFPNPVTETLTVTIDNVGSDAIAEIALYDMGGQLLKRVDHSSSSSQFRIGNYSAGTYVIKINVNNERKEWLIVKK
jgi:hypothetical protein